MRSFAYIFVFITRIHYSMLQTCSDIEEFEPVIHDINDTSARISLPNINGPSTTVINKIEYWHRNYLGCTKNKTDGFVKIRKVLGKETDINYLLPFSQYGIKIFYSEDMLTCIKETVFNTTKSAKLNSEEIHIVTQNFNATEAFFSIRWVCQHLGGPISRNIDITCTTPPCDGKTIEYTKNETVSTIDVRFNIDVNAGYILKLNYYRGDDSRYEEYAIHPQLKEPNKVRNIVAYNVNDTSVSLKWMPPEISTGYLDMYEVTYYHDINDKKKITVEASSYCRMWIEYICTTINDKFFNETYTFEIRAKNRGIGQFGKPKAIHTTLNGGRDPSEPLNVNYIWRDDWILNIKWEHPDAPNGKILKFYIDIFQDVIFTYNVTRELRYYNYEVDMSNYNLKSRKLFVGVIAINRRGTSHRGTFMCRIPYFSRSTKVENITESTFDILLPPANSYGDIGDLYVLIQDIQGPIEREELHPNESFWFDLVHVKKDRTWIAGEFDLRNISKVTIGDNTTSVSTRYSNMKFFNRMLESDHAYNMTLLLFATYLGINRPRVLYSFYYQLLRTLPGASVINPYAPSDYTDDSFNYLWSLLLIPVLIVSCIVSAIIIKRRLKNIKSLQRQYLSNLYTNPIESQFSKKVDIYVRIS